MTPAAAARFVFTRMLLHRNRVGDAREGEFGAAVEAEPSHPEDETRPA